MERYQEAREAICAVGKLLYDRGYVVSNDGNISVRVAPDRVLITPSQVGKGRMTPDMMVLCDLDGRVLDGDRYPSSESKMHLLVYREREDVMAVVHAHPPVSTAFAVCRRGLTVPYLTELVIGLGEVPVTEYATASTREVPESVRPFVHDHKAVLIANHGALTWGADLWSAFDRMETLEQTAKVVAAVEQLGGGVPLTAQQVQDLRDLDGYYRRLGGRREEQA